MLKITLVRSIIGTPARQRNTIQALGLRRVGQTVEQKDTPVIWGMIEKVSHLVEVENKPVGK